MNRRIQVCYAGGTIGMVPGPQGLTPGADVAGAVASLVEAHGLPMDVEVHSLDRLIDSAEATPEDWQAIVDDIRGGADRHDAFVVLHGTDTLTSTASALAFALTDLRAPVVVTGSQLSLVEDGSDAPENIRGALTAAARLRSGVGLYFDGALLRGPRVTKTSSFSFHGFESPGTPPLAEFADGTWRWRGEAPPGAGWPHPLPFVTRDIAVLTLGPGLSASRARAAVTPAPEALLIRAYGAGNGPDGGIGDLVAELVADGVPVAIGSQCLEADVDLGRYAAGSFLQRAGAFGIGTMTVEAAYVKLTFLLCQGVPAEEIPALMARDLAGELLA